MFLSLPQEGLSPPSYLFSFSYSRRRNKEKDMNRVRVSENNSSNITYVWKSRLRIGACSILSPGENHWAVLDFSTLVALPIVRSCSSECGRSGAISEKLPVWGPWKNQSVSGELYTGVPGSKGMNGSPELPSNQRMYVLIGVSPPSLAYTFSLALYDWKLEMRRHFPLPRSPFCLLHSVTSRAKVQVETCSAGLPRHQVHSLPTSGRCLAKWSMDAYPMIMGTERPGVFPAEGHIRETYDWWETYIGVRKSKYSGGRNVGSLCPPIPYQQQTAMTLASGSATAQCPSLATLCDGASGRRGYGAVWFHDTVMVGLVYSFIQSFTYSISVYWERILCLSVATVLDVGIQKQTR